MTRILVPIGCRSDEGLSAPIIRRLKEQDWCEVYPLPLEPQDFQISYCRTQVFIDEYKPNIIFITGDRVEMCAAAACAFHNNVTIAHYYGGTINTPQTTYDDFDRHIITTWSDIQFVESNNAAGVVWDLKHAIGLKSNIHVVGISHLDDLKIDETKVPKQPFTVILFNPPIVKNDDIQEIFENSHLYNDYTVLIGSNPDGETNHYLTDVVDEYYQNLPRSQFLGLLKFCQMFITNSSAAIYEAPYFLKPEQIIMVGDRNKNRQRGPFETGASDKIVKILEDYL